MSDQVTCAHPGCADSDTPNIAWGGTRLCGLHLRGLQADVDDIARVLTLIETDHDALTAASGGSDGVHTVPASRPPLRLAIVDVLTGQTAEQITGWASDIVRTSRPMTVPEAARLLARNIDALSCHVAVDVVAVELRQAAGACRAVLPDDRWNTAEQDEKDKPVGRCTQPHDTDPQRNCGGALYWLRDTLATRCARCGHQQQPDGWLPKKLILGPWGLERRTLDRWIAEGRVAYVNRLVCVDDIRIIIKMRHADRPGG